MLLLATLSLVVLRLQCLVNALARLDRVVAALGHWLDLVDADLQADFLSLLDSISGFGVADDDGEVVLEQQGGEATTLTAFANPLSFAE